MKFVNRIFIAALAMMLMTSIAQPVVAADEIEIGVWNKEVKVGINLLQSSYSSNWNGGNKGSIVWAGIIDANLEKQFTERTNWRNTLKLAYGQTHQQARGGDGSLFWQKPDKTDDIIDFESLFRMTPASGWDPFVAFNFKSMFQDLSSGEDRAISINPMSFKESAGISRSWIETEEKKFMTRLGVAFIQSSRQFYPLAAPDETLQREGSSEIAGEMVTDYKSPILDGRLDWESKLTLTLPFSYSGKSVFEDGGFTTAGTLPDDIASYTTSLDVDWENSFTANLTKVISMKFFLRWAYDKYDNTVKPVVEDGSLINEGDVMNAIRKGGQFKQTMALGLGYTFN